MNEDRIKAEYERLIDILDRAEVPELKRSMLLPVIENISWQRIKLDEAREEIKGASLVCEYDNGGGQKGTRENPIFKGYISLWRAYMIGLEKFSEYLPKDLKDEVMNESASVLSQVMKMKKAT